MIERFKILCLGIGIIYNVYQKIHCDELVSCQIKLTHEANAINHKLEVLHKFLDKKTPALINRNNKLYSVHLHPDDLKILHDYSNNIIKDFTNFKKYRFSHL